MGTHIVAVLALFVAQVISGPKNSADVVEIQLSAGSLADGLETYYAAVKIKAGWSLYANPGDGKEDATAVKVIEFLADGKTAGTNGITYSKGKPRRDASGKEFQANDESLVIQASVFHDDVRNARVVSVRVRVVATNGRVRLAESIVTANYK